MKEIDTNDLNTSPFTMNGKQKNLFSIIIFRLYLKMERKSSTQNERFYNVFADW